jgi:fatty acid desaturase
MSVTQFSPEEWDSLSGPSVLWRFVCIPTGVAGLWCLAEQWPAGHWGWRLFWTLVTGYSLFCWTSCFHETAHQTLCRSRGLSLWLGRALGAAMLVSYSVYRENHIRHHAYLNKPGDWELWPYSDPTAPKTFRWLFAWADLLLGFVTAPYIYSRIFWSRETPLSAPALRTAIRIEYLAVAVVWGTVMGLVGWFHAWEDFLRVWLIPHWVAGVLQSGRKFTEHLGMSSYDPLLGTRTVLGQSWWTRLCTFMNFEIFVHGPHHRHPRAAPAELVARMQAYMHADTTRSYPVFNSYWRATLDMLPFLFRNPGVGMNAGAPQPAEEKILQIENFVTDVTAEVLAETDACSTFRRAG